MRAFLCIIICVLSLAHAVVATGHPSIDEARRRFEGADFDGALQALADAEEVSNLTRSDVIELVELRAIVYNALGDEESSIASLGALASLDPGHQFPPEAPPELVERFSSITAQPLELRVSQSESSDGVMIEATALHDESGLVRRIVIRARPESEGEWQEAADEPLFIELSRGERTEWVVEAIGPGGALLVTTSGSDGQAQTVPDASESEVEEQRVFSLPGDQEESSNENRNRWPLWLGVGVGSAAVVIIAVVVGVVVGTGQSDEYTEVTGPFIEGF